MRSIRKRLGVVAGAPVALALLCAAVALANVTVYKEPFSSKGSVRELKPAEGAKNCSKGFRSKAKQLRVSAKRGNVLCAYSPPLVGDSAVPDHEIQIDARVLRKRTPAKLRASAHASVRLRAARNSYYELQIYPRRQRFRLLRVPSGAGFPQAGRSEAIKPLGQRNRIKLRAFGARVVAWVNGTRLATVEDASPGQLTGRKLAFGVGSGRASKQGPIALFDNLLVRVPNP
jgi:hypothetical protein